MHPEQLDEVIYVLRDLYRQAEDVYERRDASPHYVEMDTVMSALSNARLSVERARDELIRLDVQARVGE